MQPSLYEIAVVEHKAQTHFEGLLFLSDLCCAFYVAAPMDF
jgi:hypothetical protein